MSQVIEPNTMLPGQEDQVVQELLRNKQDLENRQFIDKTLNEFSNLMLWQRDDDYARWTERILDALALKLPILQAVLYTGDYDQDRLVALEWIGSFAYDAQQRTERWPLGEGLVGQAAQSQRQFWIEEGVQLPEHVVASGLKLQPAALLIEPLIYNGRTEGVLEVSFSAKLDSVALELLQALGRMLGANLLTLRNQQQMRRLYSEMQQKSEALAAQEEEMRQNLEEMAATQEELRRTKDEIERRQQQFDRIASNVPGILYQYYMDTESGQQGFIYATARTKEIFGIEPENLTQAVESPLELHPEDQEGFVRSVLDSAQKLSSYTWRGRIKHSVTGEYIWIQADSTPKKESETRIIWDGYMSDITAYRLKDQAIEEMNAELTAREEEMKQNLEEMAATQEELKRAKDEVERRQQQFDRMADNLPGGLYSMRMHPETGEAQFLYVSNGMFDLLGFTPEELISGESTFEIHPDDQADFAKVIMESIQRMEPYKWKGRIKHKLTQEYIWLQADSAPKLESDGMMLLDGFMFNIGELIAQSQHLTSLNQELTAQEEEVRQNLEEMAATQEELKRAKEEVERRQHAVTYQKALLDSVIDNMNHTVVAIDCNFNLLFVNEIVRNNYRAMGVDVQPGMPIFDLLPPGQKEFYENAYIRAIAGESFNVLNFFQMNGLEFRFSIDYYPLRDADGEIVGAVASAIDLNQKQDLEINAQLRLDALERSLNLAGAVSVGFDDQHHLFTIDEGGSWKDTGRQLGDLVAAPDRDRLLKSAHAVTHGQAILLQNVELTETPGSDVHLWLVPNRGDSGIPGAVGVVLTLGAQAVAREALVSLSSI